MNIISCVIVWDCSVNPGLEKFALETLFIYVLSLCILQHVTGGLIEMFTVEIREHTHINLFFSGKCITEAI